jgi:hypothetical protein
MKKVISLVGMVAALMLLGCESEGSADTDAGAVVELTEETENSGAVACMTAEDCPTIAVWEAACDGDILITPEGTGETLCLDGLCSIDFALVETDCTALGGCTESDATSGYAACGSAE